MPNKDRQLPNRDTNLQTRDTVRSTFPSWLLPCQMPQFNQVSLIICLQSFFSWYAAKWTLIRHHLNWLSLFPLSCPRSIPFSNFTTRWRYSSERSRWSWFWCVLFQKFSNCTPPRRNRLSTPRHCSSGPLTLQGWVGGVLEIYPGDGWIACWCGFDKDCQNIDSFRGSRNSVCFWTKVNPYVYVWKGCLQSCKANDWVS